MPKLLYLDHTKIVEDYLSGKSCASIGLECGCNWATIRNILLRNGIQLRSYSEAAAWFKAMSA